MAPSATLDAPSSVHLTKQEAADLLRVSLRTLDRLNIAKVKIRGRVLFRRDTLDAWSKSQESAEQAG